MRIEVLGAGCAKCRATKKAIERVIHELQADVELIEIVDVNELIARGVMAPAAVFVDGMLKSTDHVPSWREVERWLAESSEDSEVSESSSTTAEAAPCSCLYYLQEQAKLIKKAPSLYKLTCKGCGIAFSSNLQREYCFECEKKGRR
jgi:small redox-active disulfide protein 2